MAYASLAGRARVNPRGPQAFAVCDRCGFWYNRVSLRQQHEYAGTGLINLRRAVCDTCYDTPQPQLRAIVVPADPTPVPDPRIEQTVQTGLDSFILNSGVLA